MTHIKHYLLAFFHLCLEKFRISMYMIKRPYLVYHVRHKKRIKVLFIISDISMWKTENLYLQMLAHDRFYPLLLAVPNCHDKEADKKVRQYFKNKKYTDIAIQPNESIYTAIKPDIIFYQQPYWGFIDNKYFEINNRYALFCHVNYCFRNSITPETVNLPLLNIAWLLFSENKLCSDELALCMSNHGKNLQNTGLPIMDELIQSKSFFEDPWKGECKQRKRIIYAPHHSILDDDILRWGSILEYGDFILRMAEKYHEQTQWVFKPHPFLRPKLNKIWGEERTSAYYSSWEMLENSQRSDGGYIDIFKHSDALIHDCGSFMIEYLYCGKPAMYLHTSRSSNNVTINEMSKRALSVHYPAYKLDDIESFIINVINNKDSLKSAREHFYKKYLLPPDGSACRNIISCILGEKDFRNR